MTKSVSFVFLHLVCEIPRSFERSSPSDFRTQGSFIHINSRKFSNATFFRQIALQNLQRKNLGFSETALNVSEMRPLGTFGQSSQTVARETMTVRNILTSLLAMYFQVL